MATDELIANLVRDLEPVRPLPLPRVRFANWGLIVGTTAAVVMAAIGPRSNLGASLSTLTFQAHVWLLFVCAVTAAAAALVLVVPGERMTRWRRVAPMAAGLVWMLWLLGELWVFAANGNELTPGVAGVACVAKALAFAVVPWIGLMIMLGRGAPGDIGTTMAFAGLAAAAVGALGVELTCPLTSPSHLLAWHVTPVIAAVVTNVVLGRAMFTRIAGAVRPGR